PGRRRRYGRLRLRRRPAHSRIHERANLLRGVPMRTTSLPCIALLPLLPLLALFASSSALAADPPAAPPAAPTTTAPPAQTATTPATPAPAPPSPEAVAEAGRQLDLARQAFKAKRFVQAAQLFEAAAAIGKQGSSHSSAGNAWEQAERPERAAD